MGRKIGEYVGRVSVRASDSFTISGLVDGVSHRFFNLLYKKDGYGYQ